MDINPVKNETADIVMDNNWCVRSSPSTEIDSRADLISDVVLNCSICDKVFKTEKYLKKHKKHYHFTDIVFCDLCRKFFKNKFSLKKHIKLHHKTDQIRRLECDKKCGATFISKNKLKKHLIKGCNYNNVFCSICHDKFKRNNINDHFKIIHDIEITTDNLNWEKLDAFELWKGILEVKTRSKFTLFTRSKKEGNELVYYVCHLNVLESNKINGFCPAKINLKIENDGKCTAVFTSTHVGHDIEPKRLAINERQMIASKFPVNFILDDIRNGTELKESEAEFSVNSESQGQKNDDMSVNINKPGDIKLDKPQYRKIQLPFNRSAIKRRHNRSLNLCQSSIIKESDHWLVRSTDGSQYYKVSSSDMDCECDLRCDDCVCCIHEYKCTCPDSTENSNMCKHIHLIMNPSTFYKRQSDKFKVRCPLKLRHERSLALSQSSVIKKSDHWLILSSNGSQYYKVSPSDLDCDCHLRCDDCECCIHAYICTCPDCTENLNMCKHIHLIISQSKSNTNQTEENEETFSDECFGIYDNGIVEEVILESSSVDEVQSSEELMKIAKDDMMKEIYSLIHSANTSEELEAIGDQIRMAIKKDASLPNPLPSTSQNFP